MLKIRLQRVGKKHEPTFRVVVCDSKNGVKSGNNLEVLGSYDARDKNPKKVDADRVKYWISQGAQVSPTIHNFLISEKIIDGKKINVLPKKTAPKKEEPTLPEASQDKSPVVEETKAEEPVTETAVEERKEEIPAEVTEHASTETSDVSSEKTTE